MSTNETVRAAVLADYGQPIEVRRLPMPVLEPGGVIVRIEASTVCGTDVHIAGGDYAGRELARLPLILGHEMVGRIVELGPERRVDATNRALQVGDLIAWSYAWCGSCYWCTVSGQPTSCENPRFYGWGPSDVSPYLNGGFAEYAYVMPRCGIVKVPDGVAAAVASTATCAGRTAVHGFDSLGRIRPSDTVVIQGSGPVGLFGLAMALEGGAARVAMFGAPANRLAMGRAWGAAETFDITVTSEPQRRAYVLDVTDGRGADIVVECSGAAAAFTEGLSLLRRGGRYLVLGTGGAGTVTFDKDQIPIRQLSLMGTMSGDIGHYYRALEFIRNTQHRYPFGDMLGRSYGLDQIEQALAASADGTELKPVVLP